MSEGIWPQLTGRRIRQVGWIDGGAISLVFEPGTEALVLGLPGEFPFVAWMDKPRSPTPAPSWLTNLRRLLRGSAVQSCTHAAPYLLQIHVHDGTRLLTLHATFGLATADVMNGPNTLFRVPTSAWSGSKPIRKGSFDLPNWAQCSDPEGLRLEAYRAHDEQRRLRSMRKAIKRRVSTLQRRRTAILRDLEDAPMAEQLNLDADLLLAHASEYVPGSPTLAVHDWTADGMTRHIAVGENTEPAAQASRLYRQAKKIRRRAAVASQRLALTDHEIVQANATLELDSPPPTGSTAQSNKPLLPETGRGQRPARAPLGARVFRAANGQEIWVGKGAKGNDDLLRGAKPHFTWLHVKGGQGAHVVVPQPKNQPLPTEVLLDAATLAARFSSAVHESIVDVSHTQVRYVRKPRKAAAGTVVILKERVLALRREASRERRLVASRALEKDEQSGSNKGSRSD